MEDNKVITIRKCNNIIELSIDITNPFPEALKEKFHEELSYKHVIMLHGKAAYDRVTGQKKRIRTEERILYAVDQYGRLVCGVGFEERIKKLLPTLGYSYKEVDVSQVSDRPDRFDQDFNNMVDNFKPRPEQEAAILKIASCDRGIINAPPGFGKTFMYAALCLLYPNANIYIVAKRKDVLKTVHGHLTKYIPDVGQVGGGKNVIHRVTVVSADSLHRTYPDDCDILIGEEVHELGAPKASQALSAFRFARMYGFSATPDRRRDNATKKLESLFGGVIYKMNYQAAVDSDMVVPIRVRWVDVYMDRNPCDGINDFVAKRRHGRWRNKTRNQLIADQARSFTDDVQVLIMVETFEHAAYLKALLPEFELCHAEREDTDTQRYVKLKLLPEDYPQMTAARRENLRLRFASGELRKVISTPVWSTGVSFNSLSVLIRADGVSSKIMDTQIPGRVCRLDADNNKEEGLVIDFMDQFDSGFMTAAKSRRRHYREEGWAEDIAVMNRRVMPN